eukprot:CAMPEP_0195523898 /NCGR_PEP_ID=MMETSP0794_2-20130614/23391_1 /TAXON_ID=515487 /ORGANISM="Stephanopyxis turris, Strain CCMP 815" /LENGTH=308 /DNA_ID=CAMNT_0040653997 /DNA_START=220 /DNA_END=1143 /DNA_ORIENTATION=-
MNSRIRATASFLIGIMLQGLGNAFVRNAKLTPIASGPFLKRNHLETNVVNGPNFSTFMNMKTASGPMEAALKKPSKTIAVCLEFVSDLAELNAIDLATLSMQLRKVKAAALWTADMQALREFSNEQEQAKGNFPGPCPIIFNGDDSKVSEAVSAGVTAVVLLVSDENMQKAEELTSRDVELIWHVSNPEEVTKIVDSGFGRAFLVDVVENDSDEIIGAIPKGSVIVATVSAMQEGDAEVDQAKFLKSVGCTAILFKRACVGDSEDVEYASFVVDALTRKKSSEFNMTGLTGSANGHFGGVATFGTSKW